MQNIEKAMQHLSHQENGLGKQSCIPFAEFLRELADKPSILVRNIFQVFHDMVTTYVGPGVDEYPDDPESISYVHYDCNRLFVEGSDNPFFADRLFANRLLNLVDALKRGAQQNKIYIFTGPPGCGKSTFLNNLLLKFEEYANSVSGCRYEVVWHLDPQVLGGGVPDASPILDNLSQYIGRSEAVSDQSFNTSELAQLTQEQQALTVQNRALQNENFIEVPCPSHDNPILLIPKQYRRAFFDDLFENNEFKWNLSSGKEYDWVFKDSPCTICSSLYRALLDRLGSPRKVFEMLCARPYRFNRRLGQGICVFNPGDKPPRQNVQTNAMLQGRINGVLKDSNLVKLIFSRYANTNNGIYALMDIKSHNKERLIELHNIISEGIHKVEEVEENVNSLFIAVMNPEDRKNVQGFQSFSDRIEHISIPYVLDRKTEVEIYRNVFGSIIEESFLPRVLHNFARVIIATRLLIKSEAMLEWIGDPKKYKLYCDKNLQLLKMEMFAGHIPSWLSEEDRKALTAKRRRRILAESEQEGQEGFSGRDSIKIFNEFYSTYAKDDKLINMSVLIGFFTKIHKETNGLIPEGFLDSLLQMYNYMVLEEVKESLYYYNEEQISRDLKNYLFAVNFEIGSKEICNYTGEKLEISEEFLFGIEDRLLDPDIEDEKRLDFRKSTQKEYTSKTLTQEIMFESRDIIETELYRSLYERYVYNLKEKVLDPFLENENFRRAIKDYDGEDFKTYDKRIRADVTFLMNNLCEHFGYTQQGAKEVCIYVIDNELAQEFARTE